MLDQDQEQTDAFEDAAQEAARSGRSPMKDDSDFKAQNDQAYSVAGAELRQIVERIERLESEKREIADDIKEFFAEAKGRGYDTKVLRKLIALRKRDANDVAEEYAVLEMYKSALGMS